MFSGKRRERRSTTISTQDRPSDPRLEELKQWLSETPSLDTASMRPASADASFRRYFRIDDKRRTLIAMDAPPPAEDCRPFVEVATYLERIGVNAPRVLRADLERGFLLLTDLGSEQYLDHLPASADGLYRDAVDALVRIQAGGEAFRSALPVYDSDFLKIEMSLFHDWLCEKYLGLEFSSDDETAWSALTELLAESATRQPGVFVHRDYHSRNLMVCEKDNPGILDFQDAMNGPLTYDLVSLLKDCYIKWPPDFVEAQAKRFFEQADTGLSWPEFRRYFDLMGVQRHLKASGIFARLNLRDGKPGYMQDIPRTLSYITDLAPHYEELGFVEQLIRTRVLPALEPRL